MSYELSFHNTLRCQVRFGLVGVWLPWRTERGREESWSLNIGNDVQINSKDVCVTATCKHSKDIYMHKQLVTNASLCNLKHTAGTGPHVGT